MKKALLWVGASVLLSLVALAPGSASAQVTNFVTDTTTASLTRALQAAQTNGGRVMLDVDGTFRLSSTITITTNILIEAQTNRSALISGNNALRIFSVKRDAVLTLVRMALVDGRSSTGAGIYNDGTVLALGCYFAGNTATNASGLDGRAGDDGHPNGGNGSLGGNASGGAIYSSGRLGIYSSMFTNNYAFAGSGGNGGNGATNAGTFAGNGGDGANGGIATGGAIFNAGGIAKIGWCNFYNNITEGGNGGLPGAAGPGGVAGDGGRGGMGSTAYGAGIYNSGTLSIFSTLFANNSSYAGSSAGVNPYGNGTSRDAFPGAIALGGAIYNTGQIGMTNCTLAANLCQGGAGGNIASSADAKAGNGGSAYGGAIANAGSASTVDLVNCTLWQNLVFGGTNGLGSSSNYDGTIGSKVGGNLYHSAGTITLRNSILDNTNAPNCYGAVVDGGYNICSDSSAHLNGPGSRNATAPLMETSLTFTLPPSNGVSVIFFRPGYTNEFFTQTQQAAIPGVRPTAASPAIDAIPLAGDYPSVDQRGFSRPQGSGADIGAIELDTTQLAPVIVTQPVGGTNQAGKDFTLSVVAGGQPPLSYQWKFNDLSINNATNSTFVISSPTAHDSGSYTVTVSNPIDSVTSSNADVVILTPITLPGITVDGTVVTNFDVLEGTDVEFQTAASGVAPLDYQWYHNGVILTNETSDSIFLPAATAADGGTYTVVITNSISAISKSVVLVVHAPAAISIQPADKQLLMGSDVALSLGTTGDQPITYQWVWNGQTNAPTTNSTFLIRNAQTLLQNTYSVLISNRYNTDWIASSNAQVAFFPPLTITEQPASLSVDYGGDATFSVSVRRQTGDLSYQWYRNNVPLPGETNDTLVINSVTTANAGTYTARVADAVSQVGSSNAVLTVGVPPTITVQPKNQLLTAGGPISLSVKASDSGPVSYQWWHDGVAIPGETNTTLTFRQAQSTNAGSYYVTVTGSHGTIASSSALLIQKVVITGQPQPSIVATGRRFTFGVSASGNPNRYQWYHNGVAMAGQTNSTLSYSSARKSDAGAYRVLVANQLSSLFSATATLAVLDSPSLAITPRYMTNVVGSALTLTAKALGSAPLFYQWQLNGTNIPGATHATLTVPKVSPRSGGTNSVMVRNAAGTVSANVAVVTVIPAPPVFKTPVAKQLSTKLVTITGTTDPTADLDAVILTVNGNPVDVVTRDDWHTWSATASFIPGSNYVSAIAEAAYGDSKAAETAYFYKATYPQDPYAPFKGSYAGLFFNSTDPQQTNSGLMNLTLKEMGVFSGKILQGTNVYPFAGQFDTNGLASVRSGSILFQIQLHLDSPSANQLIGNVSAPDWANPDLQLAKVVYNSIKHTPAAGRYTLAFPGQTDVDGDGVLALRVDSAGNVVVTGTLADSSAVSGSGTVCADGQWPLYISADNGNGALFGWMTFDTSTNLTGNATWICPPGNLFPNGLTYSADVLASGYPSTTNAAAKLTLTAGTATLNGATLVTPISETITLSKNIITTASTNLTLRFNPATGIVTGTFLDSDSSTINPISAVYLRDQNQIRGFFIGTDESGSFKAE